MSKDLLEKVSQGRQYRNIKEIRVAEAQEGEEKSYKVRGYATTYNEPYTLYADEYIEIREQIAQAIKEVNKKLPSYKKIMNFDIRENEFIKTTTKKIKRYANLKQSEKTEEKEETKTEE